MPIKSHLLLGAEYVPSPNIGQPFPSDLPDLLVLHYTASPNMASAILALTDPKHQVSAHLLIGRTGQIVQLVPFNRIAWHAGQSAWKGRRNLNRFSIGIEIENAGMLTPRPDGELKAWFGGVYPQRDAELLRHRNGHLLASWHTYPAEQLAAVETVCRLLCDTYPIQEIVGHEEISPDRKLDPGPAFPLDELRGRLFSSHIGAQ